MKQAALFALQATTTTESPSATGTTALGASAELLLASELLARGHKVAVPLCDDDGVDLIVDYGVKVQVKSGSHRDPRKGALEIKMYRRGYKYKDQPRDVKLISPHVDVVAVYARDTRTWWFIPRDQITAVANIRLLETAQHGLSAWKEAWEVFAPTTHTHEEHDQCAA